LLKKSIAFCHAPGYTKGAKREKKRSEFIQIKRKGGESHAQRPTVFPGSTGRHRVLLLRQLNDAAACPGGESTGEQAEPTAGGRFAGMGSLGVKSLRTFIIQTTE